MSRAVLLTALCSTFTASASLSSRRNFNVHARPRRPTDRSLALRVARGGGAELPLARRVVAVAARKAFSGGLTGSIAGVAQVLMFMWLRTAMNYQYQYGGTATGTLRKLWLEGGIQRLYRGLPYALVQGPLARFGSAAANTLVLGLRDADFCGLGAYPVFVVTLIGSMMTALYRVLLMPIDVVKTVSQVEGKKGYRDLYQRAIEERHLEVLYTGALAMAASTLIGHYPWFLTFNVLDRAFVKPSADFAVKRTLRFAGIGFASSIVSDVISNPIRVLKTSRQAKAARRLTGTGDDAEATYAGIIAGVIKKDGVGAFFTRGLSTRVVANALQSIVFTVIWGSLTKD